MNEASGTAGSAAGEVMLLYQEGGSPGTSAFARDRNPIDAAADNGNVEALSVQRFALLRPGVHVVVRCSLILTASNVASGRPEGKWPARFWQPQIEVDAREMLRS